VSARPNIQPLFDWLLDGAPGASSTPSVLARVAGDCLAAGIRLARAAAFVRTLHPSVMGRRFLWRRGVAEVTTFEAPYAILATDDYKNSPINSVYLTGVEFRQRLDGSEPLELVILQELRREGLTDYLALPMRFSNGEVHAIAFSSDAAGGFSDEEVDALRAVSRPLGRVAEILAMRRIAASLLSAYVGRDAGERILGGQIQLGDTESIRCVIWFSDLRGFTALSSEVGPAELILLLNQIFDCQVPAVDRAGGEVLKFMGDGMLAIFPVGGEHAPAAVCASALAATRAAFAALDELNRARAERDQRPLAFGVSLHLGDVAYGNIGGAGRLDFTCIGPAVNLAARIEGLTGKLGKRLLLSAEFAAAATVKTRSLGAFELKGVQGTAVVHELDD
jgi:adenylate cyclase